ncbi:hypothetical protein LP419_01615 [Massilia sp. H-1]|nr:hypothetical protein LP419_01615 [Massilia sp. H-1]
MAALHKGGGRRLDQSCQEQGLQGPQRERAQQTVAVNEERRREIVLHGGNAERAA